MNIRNRVTEMRLMPGAELLSNPGNWREHPEAQREALAGILDEIGIAGALLAYYSERHDGALTLIDGHERKADFGEATWPVLITDLCDEEADLLMASLDPIGAMATANKTKLDSLLHQVQSGSAGLQSMLDGLAKQHGLYVDDLLDPTGGEANGAAVKAITLQCGRWKVPLTEEEWQAFDEAAESYLQANGALYGFGGVLVGMCRLMPTLDTLADV